MTRAVLFLSHTAELNGAERWLLETLGRLDPARFRPVLAAPGPGPLTRAAEAAGIESAAVPMRWWLTSAGRAWKQPAAWVWNVRGVRRLAAFIRERKIGLVFTNTAATMTGAWAARAAGVPHIWMIHELLGRPRPQLVCLLGRRWLLDFIVRSSAAVLVNSEAARRPFPDLDRISIVYNAMPEWSDLRPAGTRRAVRTRWGFAAADFLCGVVGKVCRDKRQREVVLAVAALRKRYPRLKLLVIGAEPKSGYARELRRLVQSRALDDAVVFAGFQDDIHSLYGALDLVVIGSGRESFGRPALEAQSLGVPVLAVAGGGIGEIVEHGRTGWIAESGTPEAIAAGIAHVLDHPGEARQAAERGRKAVRKRFAPDVQTRKIEAALEAALG
jgi:glycosyltransferase involved in cell wall biosynthesis